jgi:protein ImuB
MPVELLRMREETNELVDSLRHLGIETLGQLSALPRAAVADRFGRSGLLAHDLACGHDDRLRERPPRERVQEALELEDSTGPALEHALGVLIDRLLGRSERRGRTLRVLVLSARLAEGGTWLERVVLRQATVERERIRMTLSLRLALLPAPARRLSLRVEHFGGADVQQRALMEEGRALRLERLREAARQVRACAGLEGALRIVPVDELSRVPERRFLLTPFS